jgi:hypothetical protein
MEAATIAREIPVSIVIKSGGEIDGASRIRDAFARALGNMGFTTAAQNSRYSLEINLTLTQESGSQNAFARYTVSASLIDTRTRQALLPVYNFSGREGQRDFSRAQNRAVSIMERTINNGNNERQPPLPGFQEHLNSYFSQMLGR